MEKILVIQTAFIGDAILTLPMIQKLKEMFSSSEIHVLCIPSTEEIFRSSPVVDNIKVIDKKRKHKNIFSLIFFAIKLKRENYDRIYSPHRSFRTSLIVFLSGVKNTYGFSNANLRFVYRNLVEYFPSKHEVQRNLDLIGFEYKNDEWKILPALKTTQEQESKVTNFIQKNNIKSFIAVAPGSIWNTKKYPTEYYIDVVNSLRGKYSIVLIGGKIDVELCNEIKLNCGENVFTIAGMFSIVESVELLRRAKLLITNDSAPTHMGMCADIPTLTLYCSTVTNFGFYPYNGKNAILSFDDLDCKPCGIHGFKKCPLNHFNCGKKLLPNVVIKKVDEMLNE
jgi:heptosyltransferase-2